MGNAAGQFYSTDASRQTLHRRVRPSEAQFEIQMDRWNALADHLRDDLRERSGCRISSWLQGSYKFGTQVRPAHTGQEFDIDLGIYFNWSGEPEAGSHGPRELKDLIQESLNDYAEGEEEVREVAHPPKARCSRIHFQDDFHIDVPAYHLDEERDARALATQADEWELSDPKAIYLWFKNKFDDATRPRVRRLVRYLKMWALLRFDEPGRPSSILLTVLVADAYAEMDEDAVEGDDEALREAVSAILSRLEPDKAVTNPVNSGENLNRLSDAETTGLIKELETLLSIADRALHAETKTDASEIWSEAFDHFFPVPEEEEERLTKDARLPARVEFDPQVRVTATPREGDRRFTDTNKMGPIPRGCSIDFELLNAHALPGGAVVHWMVRNEGEEAEQKNDMGHVAGSGAFATESSAYKGRHFMDVWVSLNGRTIGRRRIPVIIHGYFMPRRNPKRPSHVRLRGRR